LLCSDGGRGPNGEAGFDIGKGVLLENLDVIGPSPLLSVEEVDFYADEYARNGMHGPLNWYRTGRLNWEEERELVEEGKVRIKAPSMIITASKDKALPPSMTAKMERWFDNLERREVEAGHWALWQTAADVNKHMEEFVSGILGAEQQASRL
jgi:soluble epoxide hydrolase / lipid-phosphate phosphatase